MVAVPVAFIRPRTFQGGPHVASVLEGGNSPCRRALPLHSILAGLEQTEEVHPRDRKVHAVGSSGVQHECTEVVVHDVQ